MNIEQLISNELHGLGFELIGVEFEGHNNSKLIRIFADRPMQDHSSEVASAITAADCGKISNYLNRVFSVLPDLQATNYSLEVSSPGVERRLFNLVQAERYVDKEIKVRLKAPVNNSSKFVGRLHAVDQAAGTLTVVVEGQILEFNFNNVAKANLVYRKFN